uniref:Acyl-glucose dependent anthocyanin 7-O-glucosyltransferase n=1 Tax=Campanula medium TaxID=56154 RepID=A0A060PLD9_CAMME|nr:Acyl-glucose dependent anthocyanin 7-O-glucosyltransferase [Campanula medium]
MLTQNQLKCHLHLLLLVVGVCTNNWDLTLADYSRLDFPSDFVFGAGTSAYQVEGAAFEDGRTPSIWDTYAHAGNSGGANADITCDGYHKYKEDVQLMVEMGLEAFRFSISWSRLIPNGRGQVNPMGLQYYNNFINELVSHGIQPHAVLFHSDHPQILEDEYGGWLSRKSVDDFVAYADVCFREFGNRVLHWTTFNEANIFSLGGYDQGLSPPKRCSFPFGIKNCTRGNSSIEPYIAGHNILLAHASTARLYNKIYKPKQNGLIGINLYTFWFVPYTNSIEDRLATQRTIDFYIGWFLNPLVFGDYPEVMKKNARTRLPAFTKPELVLVKGSFDFIGFNHYYSLKIKDKSSSLETNIRDLIADIGSDGTTIGEENTDPNQYPVFPWGLQGLLEYIKQAYGNPPIYIHENGQRMKRDNDLNDTPRVEYLHGFIGSMLDAMRNGSNTRGYFYWSFMDVYELLYGYDSAFGLYYVDEDLIRYPKLSAHWYSGFLKGRNAVDNEIFHQVDEKSSASS